MKLGGVNDAGENKKLVILLAGMVVVIVGLIVAIVVVKNLPKSQEDEIAVDVVESEYYAISNEIWSEIVQDNAEMDGEKILALYEERIEAATDEDVKLALTMDYYGFVIMYGVEDEKKAEIEEAMLAADEKLKTPLSASKVISMAISYEDQELEARYMAILEDRISEMNE